MFIFFRLFNLLKIDFISKQRMAEAQSQGQDQEQNEINVPEEIEDQSANAPILIVRHPHSPFFISIHKTHETPYIPFTPKLNKKYK
jgi:hypothetical protein